MIILYVIIVAIVLFIIVLFLFGNKPYIHKDIQFDCLDKYLAVLLKRGHNGGFMIIKLQKEEEYFLQFSKYIIHGKERGLQLDFPVAPWSGPYYSDFLKCVQEMDLKYHETNTSINDINNSVKSFVTIDFGRDISKSSEFAVKVFQDVFGAEKKDKVKLYYGNVDARDIEV